MHTSVATTATLAAPDRAATSSSSEHGAGVSSAGASSGEHGALGNDDDESSEESDYDSSSENGTNSDEEAQDDDSQQNFRRDQDEYAEPSGSARSSAPAATALAQRSLEQADAPESPAAPLTAAAMGERAAAMFVVGSAAPQASGLSTAAEPATNELVRLAFNAANDRCNADGKALSESFGNFDRLVATGWLLGDAVGRPLLSREQAHAVGLKARKLAVAIKADLASIKKDAQRKASKLEADDPKRQDFAEQAAAAEATLLQGKVELPFPTAQKPAAKKPSGSRKRARPKELTEEQRAQAADERVSKAMRVAKKEQAMHERAIKAEDEMALKVERITNRLEKFQGSTNKLSKLLRLARLAQRAWDAAQIFRLEAEVAELKAGQTVTDAMLDRSDAEHEATLAREERLLEDIESERKRAKHALEISGKVLAISRAQESVSE